MHVNFPGGIPIDGPSAGITIAAAIYSAVYNTPIDNTVAMTGEISLHGLVKPMGGVSAKIAAARQAGAEKILIPKENWQESYKKFDIEIVAVENLQQVLENSLIKNGEAVEWEVLAPQTELLTAAGVAE